MKPSAIIAAWAIGVGAFMATAFAPRDVDLWWASFACVIGWVVAMRKKKDAFQNVFGVAALMLSIREMLQHRWFH